MSGDRPARQGPEPGWGHAGGAAALSAAPAACPETERAALGECVSRYCWAFDERREDMLGRCFTEDAVWEGSVGGVEVVGPIRGRAEIIAWLAGFWPHQDDQRRHMLMNPLVERRSGTEAEVYTYLLLVSARGETVSLESTGFYRVRVVREDATWRIRHLFAGFDVPFWPGRLEGMSERGRRRHGLFADRD